MTRHFRSGIGTSKLTVDLLIYSFCRINQLSFTRVLVYTDTSIKRDRNISLLKSELMRVIFL